MEDCFTTVVHLVDAVFSSGHSEESHDLPVDLSFIRVIFSLCLLTAEEVDVEEALEGGVFEIDLQFFHDILDYLETSILDGFLECFLDMPEH